MSLPAESMGLCSSCLARQRSARQAEATPGKASRRVASAMQDEKGVPWFWKILYMIWRIFGFSHIFEMEPRTSNGKYVEWLWRWRLWVYTNSPWFYLYYHPGKSGFSTRRNKRHCWRRLIDYYNSLLSSVDIFADKNTTSYEYIVTVGNI